jgi:hypothetical protein
MTTAIVYAIVITATAIYVASAISAILDVAAIYTISTAAVSTDSATTTIFTATAVSISSASTADRSPHSVNSVRPWSYYPMAPFPQSVTNIWMETDRVGNDGDK